MFFLKNSLIKYKRRNAIINRDEACIPPVSEKKSNVNPYKKAQNKMMNLFLFNGNKKINEMYKYGLILPKKLILLNTNIWRNRIKTVHINTRILFIAVVFKIHYFMLVKIFNYINIFQITHVVKKLNIYNPFY